MQVHVSTLLTSSSCRVSNTPVIVYSSRNYKILFFGGGGGGGMGGLVTKNFVIKLIWGLLAVGVEVWLYLQERGDGVLNI